MHTHCRGSSSAQKAHVHAHRPLTSNPHHLKTNRNRQADSRGMGTQGPTRPPSLAALGRSSSLSSQGSTSSLGSASALAARFQQQDAEQVCWWGGVVAESWLGLLGFVVCGSPGRSTEKWVRFGSPHTSNHPPSPPPHIVHNQPPTKNAGGGPMAASTTGGAGPAGGGPRAVRPPSLRGGAR